MKFLSKFDYIKILIFLSFCFSLIVSNYYLNNYDKYDEEKSYHKMIKTDAYRYLSHGAEIKKDLKDGKNFFETGRQHFTKYLPPRIAAAYYYFFDKDFYTNLDNDGIRLREKVNTGIHFPYLIIQCLIYYLSLLFLYSVISKNIKKKICLPIIIFLALEPTIFQYHGTFWSESIFFSIQIILLALILRNQTKFYDFFIIGLILSLLCLQRQTAYFYIIPLTIYYLFNLKKNQYYKLLYMFFAFMIIQSVVGFNNYKREGKFYILTGDAKSAVYYNISERIIREGENLTESEFKIKETKIAINWLKKNSIAFDETKLKGIEKSKNPFKIARIAIINSEDKVDYDLFYAQRSVDMLLDNFWVSIKLITKNSLHTLLLNPFHIYSDHNFPSSEIYYNSDTHSKLILPRIVYSILIYLICLAGFYALVKKKNYKLLFIIMISILYHYVMISWHGNTRYFVPTLIYVSFLFGYGFNYLLSNRNKVNKFM
jgi:hypothetical protein